MTEKIVMHGREVSEEQIQAWADEADAGYDIDELQRGRRGRPRIDDSSAQGATDVLSFRAGRDRIAALDAIAAHAKTARSAIVREAVDEYIARHTTG